MNARILLVPLVLFAALTACAENHARPKVTPAAGDVQALAAAERTFAAHLYAALSAEPGNLACSPASIHAALACAYAGARGDTALAVRASLHLPDWSVERTQLAYGALLGQLEEERDELNIQVADALWGQAGYAFELDTLSLLERARGSDMQRVDFSSTSAAKKINRWVSDRTHGRIRNIVAPDSLSPDTRLVLTNALYFRARWLHEFSERETRPGPFHLASGETVQVPTMINLHTARYAEDELYQLAELPYKDGAAMVVVLPKENDGLPAIEKALTPELLQSWLMDGTPHEIRLRFPRFELVSRPDLDDSLRALGLAGLFEESADLSGFNGGQEPLWLDSVRHQSFIAVDEEGTEAAAATAVSILGSAAMPAEPMDFHVDRPFLFLIVDKKTEQVLFIGRVNDPRA